MSEKRGKLITSQTKELYMEYRKELTQKAAAARASISKASAYAIEKDKHKSVRKPREGKPTRSDPFEGIWEEYAVPLLVKGVKKGTLLFEELQKLFPEKFPTKKSLRTLNRRIQAWKALNGEEREVIFRQEKPQPGTYAIADFTYPREQITIRGIPLDHKLFHLRFPFSGYCYAQVSLGKGESFVALSDGLQNGLAAIGGVPYELRIDSLSAAFTNLKKDAREDLRERLANLFEHLGLTVSRNNRGEAHENGAIESPHRHLKDRIDHNLVMRGSTDFASLEEYMDFIQLTTKDHNRPASELLPMEQAALKSLPASRGVDFEDYSLRVLSTSMITVRQVSYTVPRSFISQVLYVKLYMDRLECYLGGAHAITLKRITSPAKGMHAYSVDYRHVIGSLVKKPGAFRKSLIRNYLLPNDEYKYISEYVDHTMDKREADRFIVGILHLAATYDCQDELGKVIIELIDARKPIKLSTLQDQFKLNGKVPIVKVIQPTLESYNALIPYNENIL